MSISTCHNIMSSQDDSANNSTVGVRPTHHRKSYNSRSDNSDILQSDCDGGGEQCSRPGDCLLCFNLTTGQTRLTTTTNPITPPEPPRPRSHTNPPDQFTIVNTSHLKQVFNSCLRACSICESDEVELEIKQKNGFSAKLQVTCNACKLKDLALRKSIAREKRKRGTLDRSCEEDRKKARRVTSKISKMTKKRTELLDQMDETASRTKKLGFLDSEINVRGILGAFHIGTAGYDVGKLMSMMGVQGANSFERNFTRHSPKISAVTRDVCREIMREAMYNEVIATLEDKCDELVDTNIRQSYKNIIFKQNIDDIPLHLEAVPISVSYDMGWQKRSCGKVFDSLSGHGFFIGCRTQKVVSLGVLQKKCAFCISHKKRDLPIPDHECNSNHSGSSGSMEALLCRQMLEDLYDTTSSKISIGDIVSDDDSTLRKHCSSASKGGKLKEGVCEPRFLADPSHRTKVMVKPVFNLVTKTKKLDEVKMIDALRLKKYVSCYISQNRNGDFDKFVSNAKAPVEHLFDNHEFCDDSWCYAKDISNKTHQIILSSSQKQVNTMKQFKTKVIFT